MELISDSVNTRIKLFSDKLRQLRNEKGISAREMSLALGQNVNYINLIENEKRKPSLDMFLYICEYLKVSPEYFFYDENQEKSSENYYEKVLRNLTENQKTQLAKFLMTMR
jgi:transcriptional regulator with XRE-family HTH domain